MSSPCTSIIIPTSGHRETLAQAVQSCLESGNSESREDVEVLVLPNGGGDTWRQALGRLIHDSRVQVHPVDSGNANTARNYGMSIANGTFLRFLDDDDVLYPEGTSAQVNLLLRTGADVCSSPINLLLKNGKPFGEALQPATPDFPTAVLCSKRMVQVTAHLFRRAAIQPIHWNEALDFTQDIEWFMNVCAYRELSWVKADLSVGGWRRHAGNRTSTRAPLNARKKIIANSLITLAELLDGQGRLTRTRRLAAADGLWECIHASYFLEPHYWRKVAVTASALAPGSSPDIRLQHFKLRALFSIPPIWVETAIAPKRLLGYGLKRMLLRLGWLRTW